MTPPPRDALAESYEQLSQAEAERIAAQLVAGDAVQRIRNTRRRFVILGVMTLLISAGVVGFLLARSARTSLADLEKAVEAQRRLAPVEDEE